MIFKFAAAAAALSMSAQAVAQTPAPCMTNEEVQSIVLVLLPDAITAVGKSCEAALPATALLRRADAPLFTRYRAEVAPNSQRARTAFAKIAGKEAEPLLQSEGGLALMSAFISPMIAKGIKTKDCGAINQIVELLEPLPPSNMAGLFATILQIVERDNQGKGQKSALPVCPLAP